jgi:anti-sigma regulatory factor (Ser/Thr protein kinase)
MEQLEEARASLLATLPEEWTPLSFKVELAFEELWVNVVNHAYDPERPGRIEAETGAAEREGLSGFLLRFRDWGRPFDPFTDAPQPDLTADIFSRPVGGLGIYLTKTLAWRYEYRRDGDSNLVELFFTSGD